MRIAVLVVTVLAVVVLVGLLKQRNAATELAGDAAVIHQLRLAGSDLTKPHPIEFFLYFPAESGAQHIAQKLAPLGFASEVKPSAAGSTLPWLLFSTRSMVQTEEMSRLRVLLEELAAAERGEYDGWGSPIVRE